MLLQSRFEKAYRLTRHEKAIDEALPHQNTSKMNQIQPPPHPMMSSESHESLNMPKHLIK